MNGSNINFTDKSQIIYIPEYVEQGISLLKSAKKNLDDIAARIESGISTINGSGYNRGIPYIEKGGDVSNAIFSMQDTIKIITDELEKYNDGKVILGEDAIIIADPATAWKYGLSKDDIDFTLKEFLDQGGLSGKWDSNYLTASAGSIQYRGQDGRIVRETWCDLPSDNLVKIMNDLGYDLDYWVREDGVKMFGDYVMVATDIPGLDGSYQDAEYRRGDIVQTSLGPGIVVDICGMAHNVRKGVYKNGNSPYKDVGVWYDIYTAWHDGGKYEHIAYCPTKPSCDNPSYHDGKPTMIKEGSGTTPHPLAPAPESTIPTVPESTVPTSPVTIAPTSPVTIVPTSPVTTAPTSPVTTAPTSPVTTAPTSPVTTAPTSPVTTAPTSPVTTAPTSPVTIAPTSPVTIAPTSPVTIAPTSPMTIAPTSPMTIAPTIPVTVPETNPITSPSTIPEKNPSIIVPNVPSIDETTTKKEINLVPILTGLGLTSVAGIGTKIYYQNQKDKDLNKTSRKADKVSTNNNVDEDEWIDSYDDEMINSDFVTDEWLDDDNEI